MSVVTLNQKITLWEVIGSSGFGDKNYSAPQVVDGKYSLKQEQFTDVNGDVSVSQAVFYTLSSISPTSYYVFFGESADTSPPNDAEQVRAVSHNPSFFPHYKGWI